MRTAQSTSTACGRMLIALRRDPITPFSGLITLLEKAFFKDPVNGATVFDALSQRATHAVDRRADAENYNYAAEFVAINGLIKAIVENLEAPLDPRSSRDH